MLSKNLRRPIVHKQDDDNQGSFTVCSSGTATLPAPFPNPKPSQNQKKRPSARVYRFQNGV